MSGDLQTGPLPISRTLIAVTLGIVAVIGIGFLIAVPILRANARQQQSMNNMKQMNLAALNYADCTMQVPQQYAQKSTCQGLSFRVGLIDFLECTNLPIRINWSEPWDGPTNGPLLNDNWRWFLDPSNPDSVGNLTPYRMFVGPGAVVDGVTIVKSVDKIPDGAANTILYVASTEVVPWAKPQELPYGPGVPLPALGSTPDAKVFLAAFADGSVRTVKKSIPEADLRSLIEMADGRTVQIP